MTEHVFYLAEALVVGIENRHEYALWLLDFTNDTKLDRYLSGTIGVPADETLEVNRSFTLETAAAGTPVQFFDSFTTLPVGLPIAAPARGQVAIARSLWDTLPLDARPLPPGPLRAQDYRLRLVARTAPGAPTAVFLGFHVRVIGTDAAGRTRLLFFSWTDGILGDAWVDLTEPSFDPVGNGHSVIGVGSQALEGALFVAVDAFRGGAGPLFFLRGPKLPFGAGT